MNKINFKKDGSVQIITAHGLTAELTPEDVRNIVSEYEIFYAMEDVEGKLAEKFADGGEEDSSGVLDYDREKYTPEIIRGIAKNVIRYRDNNESIGESYNYIVEDAVDEYDTKNGKDYHYEICGREGTIIEDGYVALDSAIEYALENNGYKINRIYLPLDENGQLDYGAEVISSETVWEKQTDDKNSADNAGNITEVFRSMDLMKKRYLQLEYLGKLEKLTYSGCIDAIQNINELAEALKEDIEYIEKFIPEAVLDFLDSGDSKIYTDDKHCNKFWNEIDLPDKVQRYFGIFQNILGYGLTSASKYELQFYDLYPNSFFFEELESLEKLTETEDLTPFTVYEYKNGFCNELYSV